MTLCTPAAAPLLLWPNLCAGLLGDNWLHLLELAKRNVVQPDAAVVPAAATLYAMGVELPSSAACGFDLSCMDKYRCMPECISMCLECVWIRTVQYHLCVVLPEWPLNVFLSSMLPRNKVVIRCCCVCRYAKSYEAVHLENVPHRQLTKPRKVFEYFFEGQRPGGGRENIVKLEVHN